MPSGQPVTLGAQQGSALAIVQVDGTVDVWDIPINATITITPAPGWGALTEPNASVSKASAETTIDSILSVAGAR